MDKFFYCKAIKKITINTDYILRPCNKIVKDFIPIYGGFTKGRPPEVKNGREKGPLGARKGSPSPPPAEGAGTEVIT